MTAPAAIAHARLPTPGGRGRRFRALVVKETIQAFRDPSTILIAIVLPLILLFLFGFGVSLDTTRIKIGLVLEDSSFEAQSLLAVFTDSRFFDARIARNRHAFDADLVAGRIRGIVVIPMDFSARLKQPQETAPVQVIADGGQPNTASFVQNYAQGVWANWREQRAIERGEPTAREAIDLEPRFWFNEELVSRNFLVPGSTALVMTLIGTLLTALVIAREWERGTMEAMLATPVGRTELLAGKIVPYFALGMVSMIACSLLATLLFGVPLRGSPLALLIVTAAFLCPALGQGYLISAATRNQFVASQMALFSGFLPAMLLSGFVYEIGSMPPIIRAITYIVPARYFVSSLQTVFLAGDIWALLIPDVAIMVLMGAVFFVFAVRVTRKRLG
jgi:ABC-2 type transport system permease protein